MDDVESSLENDWISGSLCSICCDVELGHEDEIGWFPVLQESCATIVTYWSPPLVISFWSDVFQCLDWET